MALKDVQNVGDHFQAWLNMPLLTGCAFSFRLARRAEILEMIDTDPTEIEAKFDEAAEAADTKLPIFVFPQVTSPRAILELCESFQNRTRWTMAVEPHRSQGTVSVCLTFKTKSGHISVPMGFGPLFTMPATRRAPWVALTTWPGGRDSQFRSPRPGSDVSFGDAPSPTQDRSEHDKWFAITRRSTHNLLGDDSTKLLSRSAFRLPASSLADFLSSRW